MGLHEIQSALRQLILDAPDLPKDKDSRERLYKDIFPLLTKDEIEDLAKMPPSGIKVYTSSVFSGERGLIDNNFPMSVKILYRFWNEAYSSKFSLLEFVKSLHKKKPWKTTSAVELGENFVSYIKEELSVLHSYAPYLSDIAQLELLIRKIRKFPDQTLSADQSLSIENLKALTVDKLLEMNFEIPNYVSLYKFDFDVVSAHSYYIKNDDSLPEVTTQKATFVALGRDRSAFPRILSISSLIFNFLSSQTRTIPISLSLLAETFISDCNQEKEEAQIFSEFMQLLLDLIEHGVIVVK